MRRARCWVVASTVIAGAWVAQGVLHGADRTRIFVTFVSHNEESISNPPCAPVMTDRTRVATNRLAVLQTAQVIWDQRATWNFQSEWEYLLRLREWETAEERDRTGD